MSLRLYGGRVPVQTGHPDNPIRLVDFPSREEFDDLYGNQIKADSRDRYFDMLLARSQGQTLADAGKIGGVTRERARQIEAKFLRLMRKSLASKKQTT